MAKPTRTHDPVRLTKRTVDAARPAAREYVLWDTDIKGFGLKVTPAGRKSYLLKYRTKAGIARKPAIGAHGTITAELARDIAKDWAAEVAKGRDPSSDRRDARRAVLAADSRYGQVVNTFIQKYAQPRQRSWRQTECVLKNNCAVWLDRPIVSLTKADAYDLLDGFVADGHEAKARKTLSWLKTLFRWAVKRDIIKSSVVEAVELHLERNIRRRFYSDDEVRAVWKAADQIDAMKGGFVKLLLLLGVRRGELAGMRRSEFDDPDSPTLWTVPHERTKTKKSQKKERIYLVPLPKLAQRVIKGLPRLDDDLVFPGRDEGKPFVPGWLLRNEIRTISSVNDFTFHPCRDTVSTWLQDQGHSEHERALVLNHAGGGTVTGEYSHGYPVQLKRQLLEEWAAHVAKVVQPEGAVLLS
ncbi:MAG: integrase family protein [Proteobacteria bacterium]|nr:integrase family protein [Pseudomonadota bacterium]